MSSGQTKAEGLLLVQNYSPRKWWSSITDTHSPQAQAPTRSQELTRHGKPSAAHLGSRWLWLREDWSGWCWLAGGWWRGSTAAPRCSPCTACRARWTCAPSAGGPGPFAPPSSHPALTATTAPEPHEGTAHTRCHCCQHSLRDTSPTMSAPQWLCHVTNNISINISIFYSVFQSWSQLSLS